MAGSSISGEVGEDRLALVDSGLNEPIALSSYEVSKAIMGRENIWKDLIAQ